MPEIVRDVSCTIIQLGALHTRLVQGKHSQRCQRMILDLQAALAEDFDLQRDQTPGPKRPRYEIGGQALRIARLQTRLSRAVSAKERADQALQQHLGEKSAGRIRNVWFLRTCLSSPKVSLCTLQDWCRDFNIEEHVPISTASIFRAKNAFCEIVKGWNRSSLVQAVALYRPTASQSAPLRIFCPHVFDEALFKMRSYIRTDATASNSPGLCRSRHSKVLNHSVTVFVDTLEQSWYTELTPLNKKDAPTLATGLLIPGKELLGKCAEGLRLNPDHKKVRFLHLLTGDAVQTNEAALRRLLACMQLFAKEFANLYLCYLMVAWLCAAHQANLIVSVAICGGRVRDPERNSSICCNCSRLFKHLMRDYAEEFGQSLWGYLQANVRLVAPSDVQPDTASKLQRLQSLYGQDVLPKDLLTLYNVRPDMPHHVAAAPTALIEVRRSFFACLYKYLIVVDAHPTVSRMFTFTGCVNALLRALLLNIPADIFAVTKTKPQEENSRRLTAFRAYFTAAEEAQKLRSACLSLQLTFHATSIASQESANHQNKEPTLVRLGKGEVQQQTSTHFRDILHKLPLDEELDIDSALFSLLTTQVTIILRFDWYQDFPTRLWTLSKVFNGHNHAYLLAVNDFLQLPTERLDAGYSLVLQQEALALGTQATEYLLGEEIQREIDDVLKRGAATSLRVERKHQVDKRNTAGVKTKSVGSCSRDSIITQYQNERAGLIKQRLLDKKRIKKLYSSSSWSLAVMEMPHLFPRARGKLWWEVNITKEEQGQLTQQGNLQELRQYAADNQARLEERADANRALAKKLATDSFDHPVTNQQLLKWLDGHDDMKESLMKDSGRKAICPRLESPADPMPEAPRLYPRRLTLARDAASAEVVAKITSLGSGFVQFGVAPHVYFLVAARREIWGLHLRQEGDLSFVLHFGRPLTELCFPLRTLLQMTCVDCTSADVEVNQVFLKLRSLAGDIATWDLIDFKRVEKVPRAARRKVEAAMAGSSSEEEFDTEAEEQEAPSDAESVDSGVESDREDAAAVEVPAGDVGALVMEDEEVHVEDGAPAANKEWFEKGECVIFNNGYFTMEDNPKHPNAKISIHKRLRIEEELGTALTSKTLTTVHYDETDLHTRTFLALRAWMLWRAEWGGWASRNSDREKWHFEEGRALQADFVPFKLLEGAQDRSKRTSI